MFKFICFLSVAVATTDVPTAVSTSLPAACTAVERQGWVDKPEFTVEMTNCAYSVFGDTMRTALCIQKLHPHISLDCLKCCGGASECARNKCMFPCFRNNGSVGCKACVATNCTPAFLMCTGAETEKQLPPVPLDQNRVTVFDDTEDSDDIDDDDIDDDNVEDDVEDSDDDTDHDQ